MFLVLGNDTIDLPIHQSPNFRIFLDIYFFYQFFIESNIFISSICPGFCLYYPILIWTIIIPLFQIYNAGWSIQQLFPFCLISTHILCHSLWSYPFTFAALSFIMLPVASHLPATQVFFSFHTCFMFSLVRRLCTCWAACWNIMIHSQYQVVNS